MRIFILFILFSCSNISILNTNQFYSSEFLKKLESTTLIYRDGDKRLAVKKLQQIPNESLNKDEIAKKYYTLGRMFLGVRDLNSALENFLISKQNVERDLFLANQVRLKITDVYVQRNQNDSAYNQLRKIDEQYLDNKDKTSYHKLSFTLSNQQGDSKRAVNSLLFLSRGIKSFSAVEDFSYKEVLIDNFKKMSDSERVYFLEDRVKENSLVIAYLGRLEALNRLYKGDRGGAEDVVSWLDNKFSHLAEISTFVSDFKFRIDNFSKINPKFIGLITPLTGKTKKWGKQALMGVNTALSKVAKKEDMFRIFIKDNKNNPYLSRNMVKELVEKHHVSVIIGGLFPELAKEEFLEARKYGVLYVSMSPVYLPRSEKNHLLIEVPGSVESQLDALLKSPVVAEFGKKMAILYPDRDEGFSYLNEFWSLHNSEKVEMVNSNQYSRGIKDYREPVKKLLGLKYPRERKEEYLVWKDIKNIEKNNVRIINVLPPVIDFDWVFIPSRPSEAIQILPTFSYFDAGRVKFVGGPSWINNTLKNNKRSLGDMYIIGNDTHDVSTEFAKMYSQVNKRLPHLVDTLSYDAMMTSLFLLKKSSFEKREDFEAIVRETPVLKGVTSEWFLNEGLWLKKMDILKVYRDGFKKLTVKDQ